MTNYTKLCLHDSVLFRLKKKRKSGSPKKQRSRKNNGDKSETEGPSTSGEGANANVPPGGDGQSSPESCPICLCRLENKSFTDSCFHTFCFVCLQEWSKQKAECPLCKQKFKSIIHNVRSLDDYDQYYIQENNQQQQQNDSRRFRYRTTATDHAHDPWLMRQQQERERQLYLLQRPSRVAARGHWRRLRQNATSAFRKRVYSQNMRVQSVRTGSGRVPRYRDVTPAFFSRNPACTHRLVPWLNREINVILQGEDHTEFIMELIIDLVQRFEIQSEEFREHIHPFIGRHTDLFIHEFFNFARSPYDIVAYDNHAIYDEPALTVESDSDRASADQEDVVVLTPPEPQMREASATQGAPSIIVNSNLYGDTLEHMQSAMVRLDARPLFDRVQEFLAAVDGGDTANSGWESPIPGPSSSVMWSPPQATTPSQSSGNNDPFSFFSARSTNTTSTEHPVTVSNSFSSSSSDSSDIEIVGYEKPFEQRTPIALGSSDSEADIIDIDAARNARKKSKKKKKKKSRDDKHIESSRRFKKEREEKHKSRKSKHRSRSRSRSKERSRRSYSRERHSYDSRPPRRERQRLKDIYYTYTKPSHSHRDEASEYGERQRSNRDRSSRTHDTSHERRSRQDYSQKRHSKDSGYGRQRSKSVDGRARSASRDRRYSRQGAHSSNHNNSVRSRSRSKSVGRSQSVSFSERRSRSISPVRPILKRRTPEIHHETVTLETVDRRKGSKSSSSKVPSRFWSPKVKFRKLQSTSKSPSPRHRFHDLRATPSSPIPERIGTEHKKKKERTHSHRSTNSSLPEKSCSSRSISGKTNTVERSQSSVNDRESNSTQSDCQLYIDSSSPEKSMHRTVQSVASAVCRKSGSKSSDTDSRQSRSVASVIRVRSRSRSRSSDCQFFISRSKYRAHDSDDSSIEFIVAKPAKRHKKHKKHKKHKRRYYVIEDTDSEGNHDIEILDVVPTKHKKKSKDNTDERKYKKHHTGHKKSSKKKTDDRETSQEQDNRNRRAARINSADSIELVAVENRNVPPGIGAEIDISIPQLVLPQEEPMNLTQRKLDNQLHRSSDSPDELHRKCEVSSSSCDVLESILGRKPSKFDPLSVAGEIVAYPLHGQERGQGDDREGSDSDKGNSRKGVLPPVKETIGSITDAVERELAKKHNKEQQCTSVQPNSGENGQQEELNRSTNVAYEDDKTLSHCNRPPFVMEWLSTQNGASGSSLPPDRERKRLSADPVMSSVAFKSPRLSDSETMEATIATSSADEAPPSSDHHLEVQLDIAQDIPEITQSHIDMESEASIESQMQECETADKTSPSGLQTLSKQTTEGFGLLPPSCDARNRSPSKDPVLFPVLMSSHADGLTTDSNTAGPSGETTAQTVSTIVETVEKELTSRRSSQSEDSNTECTIEDTLEQKSREIASVGGDKPKTPPPLAVDNMFSLGSDSESDSNDNEGRDRESPVDPNLYEFVGQMRRSPSRSASMILLASLNAQCVFNAPSTSTEEQPSDSPENDFAPRTDEEKLDIEVALPSTQGSLSDISDIVGDLSKASTSSSPARLDVEKQRIDRVMSLTKMDLFEPDTVGNTDASDSGVDAGTLDLSQGGSPLVAPSLVTDILQKDIQTNNGSSSDDLTSLEKQMREKIAARLEQKDLHPPPNQDDQS